MMPPSQMGMYSAVPGESMDDRNRHLAKIQMASQKQLEMFKRAQEQKQNQGVTSKDKLVHQYMNVINANSIYDGHPGFVGSPGSKVNPLGKMVSQLELHDPEARAGLQKILEVQLLEKKERQAREAQQQKALHDQIMQQMEQQKIEADIH